MKNILLIGLLISGYTITAQSIERQVIGSTGGTSSSGTVIVTATAGECIVTTYTGSLILTQGYQQTNSQSVSVKEVFVNASFSLFPNPTTGLSKLEITTKNLSTSARIEIYSAAGKLISSQEVSLIADSKSITLLDLTLQAKGVYLLQIKNSDSSLAKTLRIVKQ
jgi:hypothetical protein